MSINFMPFAFISDTDAFHFAKRNNPLGGTGVTYNLVGRLRD